MRYLILFFLPLALFGSKILSYNIYDRSNHADIMITFDTPYHGVIKQSIQKSKIIIKLEDASIESPKIKNVDSKYLHALTITPLQNETQLTASVPSNVKLIASKTADAYGLRLRFTDKHAERLTQTAANTQSQETLGSALPTKKDDALQKNYYLVIGILVIGILTLLYIRKKMPAQKQNAKKSTWLFQANPQEKAAVKENIPAASQQDSNEVSIRFQKAIDDKNTVVMIDFGAQSYLILMGNGNILLDKFTDNKPTSQQEFESILQSRHEELEDFLNGTQGKDSFESSHYKESLESYKEKAASLLYSEQ